MDLAGYNEMITVPGSIPSLVDRAMRTCLADRTVSHLTFPNDLQVAPADAEPWPSVGPARTPATAPTFLGGRAVPDAAGLERAAQVLNQGTKVAMLVGAGALGAREEILATAEALASPVIKTLPGKAAVPDDHPLTTGGLGLLGTKPSEAAVHECDTLLMVGTDFPYTAHLPEPGQARTVQIDRDPVRAGNRMPTEVPLVGDAAETLRALLPLLERKDDRGFLEQAQEAMAAWREDMEALESPDRDPVQPQYLMGVVDRLAADDAVLTCDSGTIATWAARHWTIRGDRQFYLSGNLATMACGLPYAIAAQWAFPGRQCIAFTGDGGLAMLMAELDTAVRYDLPITVVVASNAALGQIEWEQVVLGYPEYGSATTIASTSPGSPRPAAPPASGWRRPATSRPPSGPPSTTPPRPWSTAWSTPTSPRFPARSSSSRPRASPRRSCAASPTSSPPPGPSSRTRSTSCAADGWFRGAGQPSARPAARRLISSGETSSTWVATLHRCPNGSSNCPDRSP